MIWIQSITAHHRGFSQCKPHWLHRQATKILSLSFFFAVLATTVITLNGNVAAKNLASADRIKEIMGDRVNPHSVLCQISYACPKFVGLTQDLSFVMGIPNPAEENGSQKRRNGNRWIAIFSKGIWKIFLPPYLVYLAQKYHLNCPVWGSSSKPYPYTE